MAPGGTGTGVDETPQADCSELPLCSVAAIQMGHSQGGCQSSPPAPAGTCLRTSMGCVARAGGEDMGAAGRH